MTLSVVHPLYTDNALDWIIVRDTYAGERAVKDKGPEYLPPTQGMIIDGMTTPDQLGYQMYEAYRLRAVWHDLYKEAIEAYIGMLWSKPPTINLPAGMIDKIKSNYGETPEQLLRRINEEQLVTGRLGLVIDLPLKPDPMNPMPYVAMYRAEAIRNWDIGEDFTNQAKLNFVILDESGYTRNASDPFGWIIQNRFRVLQLGALENPEDLGVYRTGIFAVNDTGAPAFDPSSMTVPVLRGKPLNFIPFVFVNSKDLLPGIDVPPLLGLAKLMLSIYRGEADYRQNLFMQSQDTLVTIGGVQGLDKDEALRTGAGSRIDMEAGGDAKYIGVSGTGLPEQRSALQNDRSRAEVRAGQLVNARVGDKESGEALKTRLAAQTATLRQIALAGAAGLEQALKYSAEWLGENPDEVQIAPNEEFSSTLITGQDAFQLMQAKDLGLPISYESIHAWLVDRGVTKKNFEDEFKTISKERSQILTLKAPPAPAPPPTNTPPTNKPTGN